ncbi:MAG: glycosyltransferase family 39 protein [Candidatus Komeilibacteria bacterium]|nr:glycosyltransferase family 39 protein [Candidatus Komeilibacteria bacterium]
MVYWFKKIKIDWGLLVVILLGLLFLCTYSYLARQLPADWSNDPKLILNSPDETANLFFARHFAETGSLSFTDPANTIAGELVSPRSMRVINGQTVPAGFIGLPIVYGTLAKVFGLNAIPLFTPILAIIGIIFFYLIVKKLFGHQAALWSSVFAYVLPAYWYYSAKGLMPNIAFLVFFIISLYFFLQSLDQKKLFYYLFFGVFLGLSLMIRTSEVVWLGPLFLLLTLFNLKRVSWLYLFCSVVMAILFFTPVLYFNQQIYGSPLSVGYSLNNLLVGQTPVEQGLSVVKQIFLPFGADFKTSAINFYHYTYVLFPLWTILAAVSFLLSIFLFIVQKKWRLLAYAGLFLLFSAYLIVYYGSWRFNDNPDPNAVTIGTSYARYWLPIYLFSLPFIGWFISNLLKKFTIAKPAFGIFLFTCLFLVSYPTVMLGSQEGVYQVAKNLEEYQRLGQSVFDKTEANAIIIAGRLDKVFFPVRSVIFKLNNSGDYDRIKGLVEGGYPVYYFDFTLQPADVAYLNQTVYSAYGLNLSDELLKFGKQSLFQIKLKSNL